MTMRDNNDTQAVNPIARMIPGVSNDAGSEVSVAVLILAGLGTLYAIRRGLLGIGDLRITGSAVGALEWLAYAAVVGGSLRVLSTQFPDSEVIKALNFVY